MVETADPAADRRVLAERLVAQGLAGRPLTSAGAVTERLLAVQAQDPRGARLSVRSRTRGLTAADVDAALDSGELVVTWVNRGTLHLLRRDDYFWLHALTTPQLLTGNARRLGQEGVTPAAAERGVDVVVRALEGEGRLTRGELRDRLEAAGVRTQGQALVHVLMLASLRGLVVRGPMVGAEQAFVLVRDWLGEPPPLDRDAALAELAQRFLGGHGPADDRDLAKWAGIGLGDARRGLAGMRAATHARDHGLVALTPAPRRLPVLRPRLLGPYDPLLLGWRQRSAVLGRHRRLVTVNGLFRPCVLVDGHAVGTWSMPDGEVRLEVLDPVDAAADQALAREAADVRRFMARDRRGAG